MNITAFILVWIGLGLTVLIVALGWGRARGTTFKTRRTRRLVYFGFGLVLLLLMVAIPASVVVAREDYDDIPNAGVFNMTEQQEQGRVLFGERCKLCHTLKAAEAVAQVGPDLDQMRPNYNFVLTTIHDGVARGNGQMAADLVQGDDAKAVAAFVAKAVGKEQSIKSTTETK